mgnify:CR=1 FL=1
MVALVCEGPTKPIEVKLTVDHAALVRGHLAAGERALLTKSVDAMAAARSGRIGKAELNLP